MDVALSPPSGTRDLYGDEVRERTEMIATILRSFQLSGYQPLETPAFERIELLEGKYGGEGEQLIFKILARGEGAALGKVDLALRYDLTVPFARVAARESRNYPTPFKRYAVGQVWRADRPGKGRFREFTQCDIDQVGSASITADAEIAVAIARAIAGAGVTGCHFAVNSRVALHALVAAHGIPDDRAGACFVALDKLDKIGRDGVLAELTGGGLDSATAAALVDSVVGDQSVTRELVGRSDEGREALEQIDAFTQLFALGGVTGFTAAYAPTMVRGLDYYTGVIWEILHPDAPGSVGAGGRYDGLLANLGGPDLPACGGSIGLDRVAMLIPEEARHPAARSVAVLHLAGTETEAFGVASELRGAGVTTHFYLSASKKLGRQLGWADSVGASWAVIVGPDDVAAGVVTLRDLGSGEQQQVPRGEVAERLSGLV